MRPGGRRHVAVWDCLDRTPRYAAARWRSTRLRTSRLLPTSDNGDLSTGIAGVTRCQPYPHFAGEIAPLL